MLDNNKKYFEIPFRNVYWKKWNQNKKWIGESPVEHDDEFDVPTEPPIEIATKLLTKTIECKALIEKVSIFFSPNKCLLKISNIEVLSETRTCQANPTSEFETYTYTKDFGCYLKDHKTIEFETNIKFRGRLAGGQGMAVKLVLIEFPKNIKFKSLLSNDFNPYEKYCNLLVEFDYKCLDIKYIEE